jgi:hypothetical protein
MQLSILNYKQNLVKYIFSPYINFLKFLLNLLPVVYLSQHYLIFCVIIETWLLIVSVCNYAGQCNTFVLSVLLRFTDSDYPFGIFEFF